MRRSISPWIVTPAIAALIVACGSNGRDGFGNGSNEPVSNTDPGSSGSPPPGSLGSSGGDQTSGGPSGTCAADSVKATRAEVDIIIVIDTSGSMDEETTQVK